MKEIIIKVLLTIIAFSILGWVAYHINDLDEEDAKHMVQSVGWILCIFAAMCCWGWIWSKKKA